MTKATKPMSAEKAAKYNIEKIGICANLLPEPGPEVVREIITYIKYLKERITALQIRGTFDPTNRPKSDIPIVNDYQEIEALKKENESLHKTIEAKNRRINLLLRTLEKCEVKE